MDVRFRALLVGCSVWSMIAATGQPGNNGKAETGMLKKTKTIQELKKEAGKKTIKDEIVRNENGAVWKNGISPESISAPLDSKRGFRDGGRQSMETNLPEPPEGTLISSYNGLPYGNIIPPDPSIAVGPNHILQMVNGTSGSVFRITNKSGAVLIPATFMDQVTGIGGFADPIAIYDHLADRFVMMEMVNNTEAGSYGLSFAVSKTGDPTGAWDVYFLSTGANLPDFPKLSMWPDAYYITANEFTNASTYAGTFAYAIERNTMLQGQPSPQVVRIRLGLLSKHISACPVALQGSPKGSGSNGLIAWMQDDVWTTWDENDGDSIGLVKFNVNWSNPAASSISFVSSMVTVPYKSNVCTATRGRCVPQTGTSIMLEALHQKIMNQPVYRAFAGFEGLVMTHTTDAGNEQAGVRWYELRKYNLNPNWVVGQQSTWSPDGTARFMPTICYNASGDIALAYNVSNGSGIYPGIRFTGRRSCDPLNVMTIAETNIVSGASYSANARFGDYNHMVADPVTGNFWVTAEYMPSFNWATRIAHFSLNSCTESCSEPGNLLAKNIGYHKATLAWTTSAGINYYEIEYKNSADSNWTAAGTSTADSFNLEALSYGTGYSYRVRSICDFGISAWISGTFNTPDLICLAPSSPVATLVSDVSARLSWAIPEETTALMLEYRQPGDTNWIALSVSASDTVYNLAGLSPATDYEWRIKSVCTPTLQSEWATQSFTTTAEPCIAPTGLFTGSVTSFTAALNWVPGDPNKPAELEYKASGAAAWSVLPVTVGATSFNLSGLAPSTTYQWRVRTVCPSTTSDWATESFTTAAEICNAPTGAQTTLVTTASARLNWIPSPANTQVQLEYQAVGAQSWINIPVSQGATFIDLTGLSPASGYNWRVRTVCTTLQSNWVTLNFNTQALVTPPPAALATTDITAGSAQLNWGTLQGATYRLEYQKTGASAWTVLATAATSNTFYLAGLTASTGYLWRVSATASGSTSGFAQTNFSTTASCTTPTGLVTSGISSSGITLGWTNLKGVSGYRVEYRVAGAATWISSPNLTTNKYTLTGLLAATPYEWRVRTLCSGGNSAPSAIQSFTTSGPPCPDPYEPNNSKTALKAIATGSPIFAAISTGTDQDWFSFTNTAAAPNIRISLTQLPANYSMTLYGSDGRALVKAAKTGLVDETISYNTNKVGTYWVQIFPASSTGFDPSKCYRLIVNIQSGTNTPETEDEPEIIYTDEPGAVSTQSNAVAQKKAEENKNLFNKHDVQIFPNPAYGSLTLRFTKLVAGQVTIALYNNLGQPVMEKKLNSEQGDRTETLSISHLPEGIYLVKMQSKEGAIIKKFMKRK